MRKSKMILGISFFLLECRAKSVMTNALNPDRDLFLNYVLISWENVQQGFLDFLMESWLNGHGIKLEI